MGPEVFPTKNSGLLHSTLSELTVVQVALAINVNLLVTWTSPTVAPSYSQTCGILGWCIFSLNYLHWCMKVMFLTGWRPLLVGEKHTPDIARQPLVTWSLRVPSHAVDGIYCVSGAVVPLWWEAPSPHKTGPPDIRYSSGKLWYCINSMPGCCFSTALELKITFRIRETILFVSTIIIMCLLAAYYIYISLTLHKIHEDCCMG